LDARLSEIGSACCLNSTFSGRLHVAGANWRAPPRRPGGPSRACRQIYFLRSFVAASGLLSYRVDVTCNLHSAGQCRCSPLQSLRDISVSLTGHVLVRLAVPPAHDPAAYSLKRRPIACIFRTLTSATPNPPIQGIHPMSFSMSQASLPVFEIGLNALSAVLDKAEAHAAAKKN
jgi:hypothetical protein